MTDTTVELDNGNSPANIELDLTVDNVGEDTLSLLSNQEDAPVTEADLLALVSDEDTEVTEEVAATEEEEVEEEEVEEEKAVTESTKFSKAFNALTKREKEVALLENQLKEKTSLLEKADAAAINFKKDPVAFIKNQLAFFHGGEDKVDAAFEELYNTLSMHILGVDAPKEYQEANQYQKLQREFESYKEQQAREKREAEERELELQRSVKVTKAQADIKAELSSIQAEIPFLINQQEQDPGELVWELVWANYQDQLTAGVANPQPMSVREAAELANTHYQKVAQKWASIIPSASSTTSQKHVPQANTRTSTTRTLTNNKASVAPTREAGSYIEDDEESIKESLKLLY